MHGRRYDGRGVIRCCVVGLWMVGGAAMTHAKEAQKPTVIADHVRVGMEYTLTVDGAVIDSTEGKGVFHYVQGTQQIIPGLEQALAGLHVGDTKNVTVPPAQGYGMMDPAALIEMPKAQLPKDVTPAVGMVLRGVNPDGKRFQAKISDVKQETVTLDLNHPLAGKTLTFNVKITDLEPAGTQ